MTDTAALLTVQEHDTHADQLRHRLASLPEAERVRELSQARAEITAAAAEADGRRTELARDQKRREDELASLEEKVAKVEAAMYASTSAGRELQAMQDEVKAMKGRVSTLEDAILELIDLVEPLQAKLDVLEARGAEVDAELEQARMAATAAQAEIDAELAEEQARRAEAATDVPAALLAEYESIRSRLGGVGAARLNGNRCEGCHLTMAAAEVERIKRAGPDEIVHCEECGRILVR